MKKVLNTACSAFGAGLIGFFANKLDSGMGAALFALGVILLVISIISTVKN